MNFQKTTEEEEKEKLLVKEYHDKSEKRQKFMIPLLSIGLIIVITTIIALIEMPHDDDHHGEDVHFAVSTGNYYATLAGMEILEKGGNFIDAAVAVQAALTVTEPQASGIAGFSTIMGYLNMENKTFFLDGMCEQPSNLDAPPNITNYGGASVAVPGTLNALDRVLKNYGTMTLAECFAPAIRFAREGWILDEWGHLNIVAYRDKIAMFPATSALYLDYFGNPKKTGTLMKNPDLANTLEAIATYGIELFYNGTIADAIIKTVTESINPGVMTKEDLTSYKAVYREPVKFMYKNLTFYGPNYPINGGQYMGLALNMLSNFSDFSTLDWGSSRALQIVLNIQSLTTADTTGYSGDPDFRDVPIWNLLDKSYAVERAKFINFTQAVVKAPRGNPPGFNTNTTGDIKIEFPSTTHYSIIDKDGNIASVTTSLKDFFGSGQVVPGCGFLLNNFLPGTHNYISGRRLRKTALSPDNESYGAQRISSTITPTIVLNEDQLPYLALGTPGSQYIGANTFATLLNVIEFKMPLDEAVLASRYNSYNNGQWGFESEFFNNTVMNELNKVGIPITLLSSAAGKGGINIIMRNPDGSVDAFADPRRNGYALVK